MSTLQRVIAIGRLQFIKSEIDRLLVYSILFSISLVIVRIWHSGEFVFVFMPWNLFLAYIPYQLLRTYKPVLTTFRSCVVFAAVFVTWLLFIPNAFYIVTDLFHLYQRGKVPLWFDLVLLMSFAWNGMMLGFLSIRQMEKNLAIFFPALSPVAFVGSMMLLNSFGIYLGRYLRFNSWDVITNPLSLGLEILHLLRHPVQSQAAWAMILSFSVLMMIIYSMLKKISSLL
jgi:uncharacterized membrane protein